MRKKIFRRKERKKDKKEEKWVVRDYFISGLCRNIDAPATCLRCGRCGRIFLFGHFVGHRYVVELVIFGLIIVGSFLGLIGGGF